jgi:hypothetical protein
MQPVFPVAGENCKRCPLRRRARGQLLAEERSVPDQVIKRRKPVAGYESQHAVRADAIPPSIESSKIIGKANASLRFQSGNPIIGQAGLESLHDGRCIGLENRLQTGK